MEEKETRLCRGCGKKVLSVHRFCELCGRENSRPPERNHIFNFGECPECGGRRVKVYSTRKPVRTLICEDCGCSYETLEVLLVLNDPFRWAEEEFAEVKQFR